MSENLKAVLSIGSLVVAFTLVGILTWLIFGGLDSYKEKRYNKILRDNKDLHIKVITYSNANEKMWDLQNRLSRTKRHLRKLRREIPYSLPEEKQEIYKDVYYHIQKVNLFEKCYKDAKDKAALASKEVVDCAIKTLNQKDLNFFGKYGGWETYESNKI